MSTDPAPDPLPTGPFATLACASCPDLERFLVSLVGEFRLVDVSAVTLALDRIALDVGYVRGLDPAAQLDAMRTALGDLRPLPAATLDAVAIDRVLERRAGHPVLLAAIHVLAGRRAGVPLGVIVAEGRPLVAHRRGREAVVLDPADGARRVPGGELPVDARWRCPHQVAYHALTALASGAMERGDVGLAIRAAELRLDLPCDADSRTVLELELNRLRARLN